MNFVSLFWYLNLCNDFFFFVRFGSNIFIFRVVDVKNFCLSGGRSKEMKDIVEEKMIFESIKILFFYICTYVILK